MATKKSTGKAETRLPGFFNDDDGSGIRPVKSSGTKKPAKPAGKKPTSGKKK